MSRNAKKPQAPKRNYILPDDDQQPKKQTILLYQSDLKMLAELSSKYKTNTSYLLRKGIEVLYMNANNAVYWGDKDKIQ
jgi:hypothetical protein